MSGNFICNIIYLELCFFGLYLLVLKFKGILGFDYVLFLVFWLMELGCIGMYNIVY